MNEILELWNSATLKKAAEDVLPCCGSTAWAEQMASRRPFADGADLLRASDEIWLALPAADWLEAFHNHPRIGESAVKASAGARASSWSRQEQTNVAADAEVKTALAEANRNYEEKFGHIFIVCATGKTAAEILAILRLRMHNDGGIELREAADQQRQITQLRLKKWLGI